MPVLLPGGPTAEPWHTNGLVLGFFIPRLLGFGVVPIVLWEKQKKMYTRVSFTEILFFK